MKHAIAPSSAILAKPDNEHHNVATHRHTLPSPCHFMSRLKQQCLLILTHHNNFILIYWYRRREPPGREDCNYEAIIMSPRQDIIAEIDAVNAWQKYAVMMMSFIIQRHLLLFVLGESAWWCACQYVEYSMTCAYYIMMIIINSMRRFVMISIRHWYAIYSAWRLSAWTLMIILYIIVWAATITVKLHLSTHSSIALYIIDFASTMSITVNNRLVRAALLSSD